MVSENHIMQHLTSYRTWNILIQPKQVRTDAINRVSNITYSPRGQLENIYYGNTTKTKYEYIHCPNPAINAMRNYTQHYQYDALGNMLQMQSAGNWTRNYEYNNPMNNNYLLGHGNGTAYSYDAHGNILTMPHLSSMSYDYQDQLIRAGNGTFVSYYNYDAEGNRTRKVVVKNNIREERYYVNGYEIYRKYVNETLDIERKTVNISDDEKVFVRIETKTGENPVIRYQYDNHLGSACLELDDSGQIISYEEYHPFGTTSYRSGMTETEVSLKRYKYCGKERDEETGLYYYGMRYYAAWLCRFVSVDPLQFKYPELTPFQYASNRPVTMIDLDGKEGVKPKRKLSDKAIVFYKQFGNDAIKAVNKNNSQNANKFKALYILAQRRIENSFNMNPPGNNPFNVKGQGDLGTISLTTNENIKGKDVTLKQNFANFSTVEKGFEGYLYPPRHAHLAVDG